MSRLMSCKLTIPSVRARTKTVTRRDPATWTRLKAGDTLTLVEQAQGIPKGGRVVRLAEVEIIGVRVERLLAGLTCDEIEREGVGADLTEVEWAKWWASQHGWRPVRAVDADGLDMRYRWHRHTSGAYAPLREIECRRIEWRYLPAVQEAWVDE